MVKDFEIKHREELAGMATPEEEVSEEKPKKKSKRKKK